MISESEDREHGFGRYDVTVLPHVYVTLADGCRLAVKFWCPVSSDVTRVWFPGAPSSPLYSPSQPAASPGEKYPVVMEYIPYRKTDFTVERDHQRHTWLASHGYVVARVDLRGAGDSDGLMFDEYLQQEQDDACEIIQWFADQSWCNGKVGMYGKSWGGFNGLQVAWEQPPALAAVISLYSTDDRYMNDMHYEGGCVLGSGMLSWASRMMVFNALPPSPHSRDDWEKEWKERLEKASDPWATKWMSHQTKDDYWMQASVCKDYSKLEGCNILAIGGWTDGYFNTVFRVAENVSTAKGIVGPWSHQWPDASIPGPTMEFMAECLRWWDCHLKGVENGARDLPKLRVYLQESAPLRPTPPRDTPGRWIQTPTWPPSEGATRAVRMFPSPGGDLSPDPAGGDPGWRAAHFQAGCGSSGCAEWLNWSVPGEGPYDQRQDDSLALCWETAPLEEPLTLLGRPSLSLTFRVSDPRSSQLTARLCSVYPSGQSRYITKGHFNLNHLRGHGPGEAETLVPGREYRATIPLSHAGYTLPAGNKLRLAVSPCYFPIAWPALNPSPIDIQVGGGEGKEGTCLTLPVTEQLERLQLDPREAAHMVSPTPALGPPLPTQNLRPASAYSVQVTHDPVRGRHSRRMTLDSGANKYLDSGVIGDNMFSATEESEITEGDPLSAKFTVTSDLGLTWPVPGDAAGEVTEVKVKVGVWSQMKCEGEGELSIVNELTITKGDEEFYKRKWDDKVKRELI